MNSLQNDKFKDLKIEILNYFNNNLAHKNKKFISTIKIHIVDKDEINISFGYSRWLDKKGKLECWSDIYLYDFDEFWNGISKIIKKTFKTADFIIDCNDDSVCSHHFLRTDYDSDYDSDDYDSDDDREDYTDLIDY